jgi:hypothetical protein
MQLPGSIHIGKTVGLFVTMSLTATAEVLQRMPILQLLSFDTPSMLKNKNNIDNLIALCFMCCS